MTGTDDIAPLVVPPGEPELSYRQGLVVAWNAAAGTNTVRVAGAELTNLPILGGLEATTIRPGDDVGIQRFRSQYFVLGRIAQPDLASEVTVQVAGAFVPLVQLAGGTVAVVNAANFNQNEPAGGDSGYVGAGGTLAFHTYTGRWLIQLSAQVDITGDGSAGRFSYTASGAQTLAAADARSALVNERAPTGAARTVGYANVHTGSPGDVTVRGAFRLIAPPATFPAAAIWSQRAVIVIPY